MVVWFITLVVQLDDLCGQDHQFTGHTSSYISAFDTCKQPAGVCCHVYHDHHVLVLPLPLQVDIKLEEPEQGTTILTLHHTGIPHEDKYGNSDVEGTTRNGWQQLILHRIKAVFGYGL